MIEQKEIEKYRVRDYYIIPVEIVDNIFYLFEQQCEKQKWINIIVYSEKELDVNFTNKFNIEVHQNLGTFEIYDQYYD